jgi:hypothetical protein
MEYVDARKSAHHERRPFVLLGGDNLAQEVKAAPLFEPSFYIVENLYRVAGIPVSVLEHDIEAMRLAVGHNDFEHLTHAGAKADAVLAIQPHPLGDGRCVVFGQILRDAGEPRHP